MSAIVYLDLPFAFYFSVIDTYCMKYWSHPVCIQCAITNPVSLVENNSLLLNTRPH